MVAELPRKGDGARKMRKPKVTPLDKAAEQVHRDNNPIDAPAAGDFAGVVGIDPADLSYDICKVRERLHVWDAAYKFQAWLARVAMFDGVPLDNVMGSISILVTYYECMLVDKAMNPQDYSGPTLPGCWGQEKSCTGLRHFGHAYCPECEELRGEPAIESSPSALALRALADRGARIEHQVELEPQTDEALEREIEQAKQGTWKSTYIPIP